MERDLNAELLRSALILLKRVNFNRESSSTSCDPQGRKRGGAAGRATRSDPIPGILSDLFDAVADLFTKYEDSGCQLHGQLLNPLKDCLKSDLRSSPIPHEQNNANCRIDCNYKTHVCLSSDNLQEGQLESEGRDSNVADRDPLPAPARPQPPGRVLTPSPPSSSGDAVGNRLKHSRLEAHSSAEGIQQLIDSEFPLNEKAQSGQKRLFVSTLVHVVQPSSKYIYLFNGHCS